MEFLEFEVPIKEILDQIEKCKSIENESDVDITKTYNLLQKKLVEAKKDIYGNLSAWQKVQLSRHPNRPYTLDYINNICGDSFLELHGDRNVSDDKAMIGGLGKIDNQSFMFIGTQKGYNTKTRQYRNFGMANPEGYRKALRLMRQAEKFNIPIVTFIDTPGAFPGLEAEERGQGEAIARNIYEMMNIKVPIICIVIGEGASGGALGIGVSQENFMLSRSAGGFMTKATAIVATLFIICSLALTIISRAELTPTSSVLDTIEEKTEDTPSVPENN